MQYIQTYCETCHCSSEHGIVLPEPGQYATGMLFLDKTTAPEVQSQFTKLAEEIGLQVSCADILY